MTNKPKSPDRRRRKILLVFSFNGSKDMEAIICTPHGYPVCKAQSCPTESDHQFRQRAKSIAAALEQYQGKLISTSPDEI